MDDAAKGSELKGSCPLKGSTVGGAVAVVIPGAEEAGRDAAEELLDTWEELPPEKGSLLLNNSSPVVGAEPVGTDD